MIALDEAARVAKARELAETLPARGVRSVGMTVVDNAGVARVKTVPLALLERAVRFGIGLSPVFGVMMVNDHVTTSPEVGGPAGDLRLMLDPDSLRVLAAQPGFAWAPADQFTQDGEPFGNCQRSFLKRMVERAAAAGFELSVGCEIEWFHGREDEEGRVAYGHRGPAYSMSALAQTSDFVNDLIGAFDQEQAGVDQFHPEYALGQMEISLAHRPPVAAADLNVLVRQTIRSVAAQHGWQASFSPTVIPGEVGNGGHIHYSLNREGRNLFAGGQGPYGMTDEAEAFMAGVLEHLPALLAVGCPSMASYLRLVPSAWAGVYQIWGKENREAAVRFVTGMVGQRETSANCEVKCFDSSANTYLVTGALIAAGLDGVKRSLRLPPEFPDDPASHPEEELEQRGVKRLPTSLADSLDRLDADGVIKEAMGSMLFGAFTAVRRAEMEFFSDMDPDAVAAAHRWRY
jgi:glutamine synthetase